MCVCLELTLQPNDGLLPRTALRLMELVNARRDEIEYTLRVTCVEIYNEHVRDLFDAKKESLAVRWSKDHGFFLENATVIECATARDLTRVVKLAATNRIKSSHLLNDRYPATGGLVRLGLGAPHTLWLLSWCRSNRSHCLVTIYIDSAPRAADGVKKYGKLTIVDLAGSERANVSLFVSRPHINIAQ